jgi:RNA recognition motif-containing protein
VFWGFKGRAMPVRLFVGNLPYDVTEPDLREFFSPVGPLSNLIIPVDRETGKRRGFAFVEFSDPAQAEEASRRLNNQSFRGRTITINEARAKESRPDSGPPGTRSGYSMRPAGVGGMSRPSFTPRLPLSSPDFAPNPMENGRAARAERRSRNFGADAKPARKRKSYNLAKGELGRKRGPIRERVGGQFFGSYEDEAYEDELESDSMHGLKDSDEEDAV